MTDNISAATFVPIIMAAVALVCGSIGNFNCRSVEFPKTGSGLGPTTIDAGVFGYQTKGYYATEDSFWVVDICRSYTDIEDDYGFAYDVDRKMEAIQNIAIAIVAVGGFMLIGACTAPCFPCHPMLWKVYGLSFLVMSILQGVTLLVLQSSVCLDNPVLQFLEETRPNISENYPDECEWGMGFRMSITATVFWFVAGVATLVIPSPYQESFGPSGLPPSEELALEEKAKADDNKPEGAKEVDDAKPDEAVTEKAKADENKPEVTKEVDDGKPDEAVIQA